MKNKSKFIRRLSAMLVAVLCVCMLCVPAFASDGEDELLDYGIFEQRDYRQFWNGSFASKFPAVVVYSNGVINFFTSPLYATNVSSDSISCKTSSITQVTLFGEGGWGMGHAPGHYWANSPIYNTAGEQIYTPTPLGEFDSVTGKLNYGSFYQYDYRSLVFGSLAEQFPYVVVTDHSIYLYSDPIDAYVLGENLLFRSDHQIYFNDNGLSPKLTPNKFWYNHNIKDAQGNVVYRTYPVVPPEFLEDTSAFVDSSAGWIGSFVSVIVSQPLLLCFFIVSLVGLAVTLIAGVKHW